MTENLTTLKRHDMRNRTVQSLLTRVPHPAFFSCTILPVGNSMVPTFHLSGVRTVPPSMRCLMPCSTPKYTHEIWHRDPPLETAYTVCAFLVCPSVNPGLTFRSIIAVLLALVVFLRVHLWNTFLPLRILHLQLKNSQNLYNQELVC